ncbi:MAG: TolC family protein [Bacteroidetes bacterium]|nr:TolC family protein [Bacteroidota bacterium]
MKKITLVIFLLAIAAQAQQTEMTLEESLRMGLANSKEIQISQSILESSKERVGEMTAQMFPQIKLVANYTKLSEVTPFEVNVPFAAGKFKIQDPIYDNYGAQLSIEQPLFTGFMLSSVKSAAENQSKAIEVEHQKAVNKKALEIHQSFWNYHKAVKAKKLIEENLAYVMMRLKDTENFVKNGLTTTNDLLKLKVHVANNELMLVDAENREQLARVIFNKNLGLKLNSQTSVSDVNLSELMDDQNYDSLLEEALRNREELKAFAFKKKAAVESIYAAKSNWYPQVFAFGNFYYMRPNQRFLPLEDKFYDTWDLGIALEWNLWDWGKTSSKTAQAKQTLFQTEKSVALLKEGIEVEVYQNYLTLLSELKKVELNELTIQSAEENFRITKEKYYTQLTASAELIDAEVELLKARTNYSNALIDLQLSRIKLNESVGRKIY